MRLDAGIACSLTNVIPKPLLLAGGKRLIEWQIEALHSAGVREIVINTAHLPDQFETALGDGRRYDVALHYSREGKSSEDALETLGGIVKALPWLGSAPFIVTSGDIVTDYPYQSLAVAVDSLQQGARDAHLVLVDNPPYRLQGDMGLVKELLSYRIDPDAIPRLTYANIGVFAPRLFNGVAMERAPLFPWLFDIAHLGRVSGEQYAGRWFNAGTPDDLAQLDAELSRALTRTVPE